MWRAVRFSSFRFVFSRVKSVFEKIKPLQEAKSNVVAVVPACPTHWDFSDSPKTLLFNFKSSSVSRNSETGSRYMGVVPVQAKSQAPFSSLKVETFVGNWPNTRCQRPTKVPAFAKCVLVNVLNVVYRITMSTQILLRCAVQTVSELGFRHRSCVFEL